MVPRLKRITTRYNPAQDRFCLIGEVDPDASVVIWLTQRLLLRLVPALLERLEKDVARSSANPAAAQALHGFAQDAARAALAAQPPVSAQGNEGWLARAVDLSTSAGKIVLEFRGGKDVRACVGMSPKELRHWLSVLRKMWTSSGWPSAIW